MAFGNNNGGDTQKRTFGLQNPGFEGNIISARTNEYGVGLTVSVKSSYNEKGDAKPGAFLVNMFFGEKSPFAEYASGLNRGDYVVVNGGTLVADHYTTNQDEQSFQKYGQQVNLRLEFPGLIARSARFDNYGNNGNGGGGFGGGQQNQNQNQGGGFGNNQGNGNGGFGGNNGNGGGGFGGGQQNQNQNQGGGFGGNGDQGGFGGGFGGGFDDNTNNF